MNRRSFLGLGLQSAVLAVALTTGLAKVSVSPIRNNRQALLDLLERRIESARKNIEASLNKTVDEIWTKPSGAFDPTEYSWTEVSESFVVRA